MPGPIVQLGAAVLCAHGGVATPTSPVGRVLLSGQPVVTIATPYVVAGCGLSSSGTPCATGQWVTGATRVLAVGVPVALQAGNSITMPTGTPMAAVGVQPRASAT